MTYISQHLNAIFLFGATLLFGYLLGRVANFFKLPRITGYIVAGILMGPNCIAILPEKFIQQSNVISNFALCIITYAIGGSLYFKRIKEQGKSIICMTLLEAEGAFILVTLGLFIALPILGKYSGMNIKPEYFLPLAILAGALASPTDPTAVLAVREEYKAKGPVTNTILGIAAFDDATGIINFSIATAVAIAVLGGASGGMTSTVLKPLTVIGLSILTGAVIAFLLLFVARKVTDKGSLIVLIFGSLFVCFGFAQIFKLDELLCTMTLGCVVVNFASDQDKFFISIRDYFEEFIFVIFFVLAGAHLQLNVFKNSIPIVLVFVILRTCGKVLGVFLGGVISKAPLKVRKYTAFGLIPQGGIVVGLALLMRENPEFSDISLI
ncbi:MAG: cation:proton antiporter, partial [Candidatus Omnitrophica bacterium]|nr:cation:proton antiporter [Candidatus Omnitrophota bacterium]